MSGTLARESFGRQARTLAAAAVFHDRDVLEVLVRSAAHGPGRRCIDVGCGPGIVLEALARHGGEVVGVDVTPEMVQLAQERCRKARLENVRVQVGPGETLPFPDGHFDSAVTRTVLHHVQDPHVVLAEMTRVVRPGGRMVIADIVSSDVSAESDLQNALEIIRDPSHVHMLPRADFLKLGESHGLRFIDRREWVHHRELEEWLKIANAPERAGPLRVVMTSLAQAGCQAGMELKCTENRITFEHHLWMLVLEKP